jgi:PRTRC genetic system ThiF family protein
MKRKARKQKAPAPRFATKAFLPRKIGYVLVVGCGGTGSILAEHLARLVAGFNLAETINLTLCDGDVVNYANIARQNFLPSEIGSPKAQALALRLAGQFGLNVGSILSNIDEHFSMPRETLLCTCTDTLISRKWAARSGADLWLDVGNELAHGQAVLGTTHNAAKLAEQSARWEELPHVHELPTEAALSPSILRARRDLPTPSCADQPFSQQGFGVNALAALAAAAIVKQVLVDRAVATPQIYFNVAAGRMLPRLITREWFEPYALARDKKGRG